MLLAISGVLILPRSPDKATGGKLTAGAKVSLRPALPFPRLLLPLPDRVPALAHDCSFSPASRMGVEGACAPSPAPAGDHAEAWPQRVGWLLKIGVYLWPVSFGGAMLLDDIERYQVKDKARRGASGLIVGLRS